MIQKREYLSEQGGYIQCPVHGRELGYVVCFHVMDEGAAVARTQAAKPEDVGIIECSECASVPMSELEASNYTPVCGPSARQSGWLPAA
jgi:hypothetical protein